MTSKTRKNMIGVVAALMLCSDLVLLIVWSGQENRKDWIDVVCGYGLVNAAIMFWLGWQIYKYEDGYLRCKCGGILKAYGLSKTGEVVSGRCQKCYLVVAVDPVLKEKP